MKLWGICLLLSVIPVVAATNEPQIIVRAWPGNTNCIVRYSTEWNTATLIFPRHGPTNRFTASLTRWIKVEAKELPRLAKFLKSYTDCVNELEVYEIRPFTRTLGKSQYGTTMMTFQVFVPVQGESKLLIEFETAEEGSSSVVVLDDYEVYLLKMVVGVALEIQSAENRRIALQNAFKKR